ncbi:MAG: universal stress protein [Beijerinckiaceae bacterium]
MPTSAYKNALLPMISYPQPTLPAAISGAIDSAAAIGLRLVGLDMQINPPVAAGFGGYAMPIVGTTIDAEDVKTKANAEDIARDFLGQARHRGVEAELRRVTCDALDAPGYAAATARLFDLTIVPAAPDSRADRELAEAIVFGSGRPCLLLPHYRTPQVTPFDRPLIAWDASRAAARALADSLPMLKRAMEVFLINVGPKQSAGARSIADVERWLSDHRVRVNSVRVDGDARSAAAAIEEHARAVHANLIVMGAFGHSRVRDFILGGVTRSVLAEPRVPVLFSH